MTHRETSSSFPPSPALLTKTLAQKMPTPMRLANCVPLAGDASNRKYFRLTVDGGPVASLILMQLADPEGFKASEEAVSGEDPPSAELPFINVLKHLSGLDVAVPKLYYFDEDAGLLYLEDFGDRTLADACAKADPAEIEARYEQAIDTLVAIHLRAAGPSAECVAARRSFDAPLLMWEFEHFLEYGVVARHGRPMRSEDHAGTREVFQSIANVLAGQPHVFTHRDYHSRNLMVDGDRLGVIDFQDALMGPATYDLASLLRDSYIALEEGMMTRLIDRYRTGLCAGLSAERQEAMGLTDAAAFRRLFDFTSVQRNLKAAGRFVYIDRVKGNPKFLADIPRTLGYVAENLRTYEELRPLLKHLGPYVPEWGPSR